MTTSTIAPLTWESQLIQLGEARARTDELFRIIGPETFFDRPIPERHRIIFYVGHLEAFDWNLIWKGAFARDSFSGELDRLFAFGIDPVNGTLPSDQPDDWPSLAEVREYCGRVRTSLDGCLRDARTGPGPSQYEEALASGVLLQVAIEHRLMHAETLAYMLHQLPYSRKRPQPRSRVPEARAAVPRMIEIAAGRATLGQNRGPAFGWDNEFAEHSVEVPAFRIDAYKVTNGRFLEFVRAGGYDDRSLWTPEAWAWKEAQGIQHPVFWVRSGERFEYRAMFEQIALPLDWPVYVSHAEATAYSHWAGKSLPTEAQWHRAAYGARDGSERIYPWGHDKPRIDYGNFDFERWDPVPEGVHPAGRSGFGVEDMVASSDSLSTRAIRRISSIAGTTSSKEDPHGLRPACCAGRSATGSSPTTNTCTPDSAASTGPDPIQEAGMRAQAVAPIPEADFATEVRPGLSRCGQKELPFQISLR